MLVIFISVVDNSNSEQVIFPISYKLPYSFSEINRQILNRCNQSIIIIDWVAEAFDRELTLNFWRIRSFQLQENMIRNFALHEMKFACFVDDTNAKVLLAKQHQTSTSARFQCWKAVSNESFGQYKYIGSHKIGLIKIY